MPAITRGASRPGAAKSKEEAEGEQARGAAGENPSGPAQQTRATEHGRQTNRAAPPIASAVLNAPDGIAPIPAGRGLADAGAEGLGGRRIVGDFDAVGAARVGA